MSNPSAESRLVAIHTTRIPKAEAKVAEALAARDVAAAALHAKGWSYQRIADRLGVSNSTVQVWVQRANGTPSPSRISS